MSSQPSTWLRCSALRQQSTTAGVAAPNCAERLLSMSELTVSDYMAELGCTKKEIRGWLRTRPSWATRSLWVLKSLELLERSMLAQDRHKPGC